MKKALTLLVVLAVVVPTMANIELFWSDTGLTNSALQYSTAMTNFLPIVAAPAAVTEKTVAGTYDLYLWGRFNEGADVPSYTQIYGLDLKWENSGGTVADNAAYRQQKLGSGAYKRWDGSNGILLDGVMAAVTASGVQFILPPDTNNDLYNPATHEFLLGAAKITLTNMGDSATIALDATPPGLGIAMRYIGAGDIPDPAVLPATVTLVPEPASLALLALAGLLRRR